MRLLDSLSIHYFPFRLPDNLDWKEKMEQSVIWQRQELHVENGVLYDHVSKFMYSIDPNTDTNGCIIYSFKPKEKTPLSVIFNNKTCQIDFTDSNIKRPNIPFIFSTGNELCAPKLILYPNANIGILSLGVEFEGEDLDNLIDFNYILHKIDNQSPRLIYPFDRSKYKPKEGQPALAPDQNLYKCLAGDESSSGFYLHQLRDFLLKDLSIDNSLLVNATRTHVFTYFRVDCVDNEEEFRKDYTRILRCQNKKYSVSLSESSSGIIQQSFENIYFGSCVEGGSIAVIASDNDQEFLRNFKTGSLLPRYIWIYLLALVQKQTLLAITSKLTNANATEILPSLVEQLANIQINTSFVDISDYTQHNTFYRLCAKNLTIPEYIADAQNKLEILNESLSRKHHQAQEQHNAAEKEISKKITKGVTILTIAQIFFAASQFYFDGMHYSISLWLQILLIIGTLYFLWEALTLYWNNRNNSN